MDDEIHRKQWVIPGPFGWQALPPFRDNAIGARVQ